MESILKTRMEQSMDKMPHPTWIYARQVMHIELNTLSRQGDLGCGGMGKEFTWILLKL
jgi:hypothetical protein